MTRAARVLWPAQGLSPPDGSAYPPLAIAPEPLRSVAIDAALPRDQALIVAQPWVPWMSPAQIDVTVNGMARAPLARDAAAAVYACSDCAGDATVAWRVTVRSLAPERVDIVTIAPPRRE